MTEEERLVADYAGSGLTIGRHPMALRRRDLSMRGVLRAADLSGAKDGRRVRVAGMVITRQRPGTAKGFVFLTLEDETGISNVIIRPDLFDRQRNVVVRQPFLLVDSSSWTACCSTRTVCCRCAPSAWRGSAVVPRSTRTISTESPSAPRPSTADLQ